MKIYPTMPNSPCQGCTERKVNREYNCHSHCERHAEWKRQCKDLSEVVSEEKQKDTETIKRWARCMRYREKKKRRR